MRNKSTYISDDDIEWLRKRLAVEKVVNSDGEDRQGLEAELSRTRILASRYVPQDLVLRNFRVWFVDPDTGEELTCSLIFPGDVDIKQHKISVLARILKGVIGSHQSGY